MAKFAEEYPQSILIDLTGPTGTSREVNAQTHHILPCLHVHTCVMLVIPDNTVLYPVCRGVVSVIVCRNIYKCGVFDSLAVYFCHGCEINHAYHMIALRARTYYLYLIDTDCSASRLQQRSRLANAGW